MSKSAISIDITGGGQYIRERLAHPEACDSDSFRTVSQGNHQMVFCCKRGHWGGGSCSVNQTPQSRLHPRSEEDMILREAARRGIPVLSDDAGGFSMDEHALEADVRAMISRAVSQAK